MITRREIQELVLNLVREKKEVVWTITKQEPNLVKLSPLLRDLLGREHKTIMGMKIVTEYNSGVILEVAHDSLMGNNKVELHNLIRKSYFEFINSTGRIPRRAVIGREIYEGLGEPKKLYGMEVQVSDLEGIVICLERGISEDGTGITSDDRSN